MNVMTGALKFVFDRRLSGVLVLRRCIVLIGSLLPFLVLFPVVAHAQGTAVCPAFTGHGHDYTNAQLRGRHLAIVEQWHFTEDVRALRRGVGTYVIGDLEYVLNWFPNHHPALDALVRLALREGTTQPQHAKADIECRFEWAIQTQPRDAMVRVIRANYYHRLGRHNDAREQLRIALTLAPDDPEVHYNLGLALYRLGDYENARIHAAEAYGRGYPLPGLRNMLARAGYPLDD
jgi:hypothetical protein